MNKRNWLVLLLVGALAITSFNSCKKTGDNETDSGPTEWTRSNVFTGDPVSGAATFTVKDVAYVVGGFLKTAEYEDFNYAFDGTQWTKKNSFTGPARQNAVGFAIGDYGYVGLGYGGEDTNNPTPLNDFYRYNTTTGAWSKIADFPGDARFGAVAFTLGNYAYVGLGQRSTDKAFSDFYKYDPASNSWSEVGTQFAFKKSFAYAFVIGNKAYVGGGISNNQPTDDFYSFDGTNWEKLNSLKTDSYDARRYKAVAFSIGNYGYVVSGRGISGVVPTVWKYDPNAKSWTDKHESLTGAREEAVGFAIKNKGYITTGRMGSSYFDETWEFLPVR